MGIPEFSIVPRVERFQQSDARKIFRAVLRFPFAKTIVIDLSRARDATTDAFADLILLRRRLLKLGRDLRLCGLKDRAARVYQINRLAEVLPLQ